MMKNKIFWILVIALVLVGCGGQTSEEVQSPEEQAMIAAGVKATFDARPTNTPAATQTPTITPTFTPTATYTPSPTPIPLGVLNNEANIYEGAAVFSEVVYEADAQVSVTVLGTSQINPDELWYFVETESAQQGWVQASDLFLVQSAMVFAEIEITPFPSPIPTDDNGPQLGYFFTLYEREKGKSFYENVVITVNNFQPSEEINVKVYSNGNLENDYDRIVSESGYRRLYIYLGTRQPRFPYNTPCNVIVTGSLGSYAQLSFTTPQQFK